MGFRVRELANDCIEGENVAGNWTEVSIAEL